MVDGRTTDDGRMDDGRRLDGYTISSPCEPNGSGELIMSMHIDLISQTEADRVTPLVILIYT